VKKKVLPGLPGGVAVSHKKKVKRFSHKRINLSQDKRGKVLHPETKKIGSLREGRRDEQIYRLMGEKDPKRYVR